MVSNTVRFYYGETTGQTFKKMAFDDYDKEEADQHEEILKKENLDYLRVDL
jgi:hypothetical protein